ncbi:hypothetical protein niasHT_037915 [Heterodera trifolii]|uniref:Uncharacterized protein n=1 Tax=Heterodera trifolii TaxID=157864 RepID=A0ABD2HRV2_9BILA
MIHHKVHTCHPQYLSFDGCAFASLSAAPRGHSFFSPFLNPPAGASKCPENNWDHWDIDGLLVSSIGCHGYAGERKEAAEGGGGEHAYVVEEPKESRGGGTMDGMNDHRPTDPLVGRQSADNPRIGTSAAAGIGTSPHSKST